MTLNENQHAEAALKKIRVGESIEVYEYEADLKNKLKLPADKRKRLAKLFRSTCCAVLGRVCKVAGRKAKKENRKYETSLKDWSPEHPYVRCTRKRY